MYISTVEMYYSSIAKGLNYSEFRACPRLVMCYLSDKDGNLHYYDINVNLFNIYEELNTVCNVIFKFWNASLWPYWGPRKLNQSMLEDSFVELAQR